MDVLIVFLLSLIVVLLAVLIVVLIKNKNKKVEEENDKEEDGTYLKNRYLNNITLLTLPLEIESLSNSQVRDISRKVLRIFESLDYKKNSSEYIKDSWHSWQVSILLSLYKRDMELFVPNKENIFRDEIVDQSESSLKEVMGKLLTKYKKEVKTNLNKETLSKNRIWNGEEVSIILCFLSKYKNFKS